MKKVISWSGIAAILFSQTGCVGNASNQEENFPYATQEIKQQLAEKLLGQTGSISADYFETINYIPLMQQMMQQGPSVFGEKEEQQVFWYYLMRLRMLILYYTYPRAVDDWGILVEQLNTIGTPARTFIEQHAQEGQDLFASVIAYEEKYPYNPQKGIDEKRAKLKEQLQSLSADKPDEKPNPASRATPGMITFPNTPGGKEISFSFEEFEKLPRQEFKDKLGFPAEQIDSLSDEDFARMKQFAIESQKIFEQDLKPWQFIEKVKEINARYHDIIEKGLGQAKVEVNLSLSVTDDQKAERLQQELNSLEDVPEKFPEVREQILQAFKNDLEQMQSGLSPEEYAAKKKAELGIAEYSIYLQASPSSPAELFFAEFILDTQKGIRYSFRKLFFSNDGVGGTRIEDEKLLPRQVDMMWYSIVENKAYSLQADLPYDVIKEKFIPQNEDAFLGLLLTLYPYGKVELYIYNTVSEEKELVATFQAQEATLSLDDFRQAGALYESADNPAKDWADYQQKALAHFPQVADVLSQQGLPINFSKLNELDEAGETRLIHAVRTQKEELFHKLLEAGADVNMVSKSGQTALSTACAMGHTPYVKSLIQAGANVNQPESQGQTPLMLAAMAGHTEIVNMLLEAGADVNAPHMMNGQDIGYNALKYAQENNQTEVVNLLLAKGAQEPQAPAAPSAGTASSVDQALMMGDTARVKELLTQGADPNAQVPGVGSVLLFACTSGNQEAAQALIEAKADVNAVGPNGFTPLMMAAQLGNKALAEMLIKAGADVNIAHQMNGQPSGLNALKMAQNGGFTEIAELLKAAGATE